MVPWQNGVNSPPCRHFVDRRRAASLDPAAWL
jgi:hypothetical protein